MVDFAKNAAVSAQNDSMLTGLDIGPGGVHLKQPLVTRLLAYANKLGVITPSDQDRRGERYDWFSRQGLAILAEAAVCVASNIERDSGNAQDLDAHQLRKLAKRWRGWLPAKRQPKGVPLAA